VGSDVYFFVCTWVTEAKVIYMVNLHNFFQSLKAIQIILHAGNVHQLDSDVFQTTAKKKYHISQIRGE